MPTTDSRRHLILSIVANEAIETQDQLVDRLRARGIEASQASVSRDIAALGLIKVGGRYVRPSTQELDAPIVRDPRVARLREHVLSMRTAGPHMLVLRTPPGEASGCALALDGLNWPEIAGTIAGDDTIFVAVETQSLAKTVERRLKELMG